MIHSVNTRGSLGFANSQLASPLAQHLVKVIIPSAVSRTIHSKQQQRNVAVQSGRPQATQPVIPQVFYENGGGDPILAKFQKLQQDAPKPEPADLARTWMALGKHGVLATIDSSTGFPATSVVEYLADAQGRPVFAVSTRSFHTADLLADGKISLTVTSPAFSALSDGRVSIQGTVRLVQDDERPALREAFLKKYPSAFYVDFGDFKWFILDDIKTVRFNGGFAAARVMTADEFYAGTPDPVAAFSGPVCGHMNADHDKDNLAMVRHYTGLVDAETVKLLDLDRLGMNAEATRKGQKFKLRLPFPRPAEDRKSIKDLIVEMTRTSRQAMPELAPQKETPDR